MKVAIASTLAPFIWGGAEELTHHLRLNLIAAGHQAEILRVPFAWEPMERVPAQVAIASAIDVSNADMLIGIKFPAYLVPHPNKRLWVLHQFRQVYDLHEAGITKMTPGPKGERMRAHIRELDDRCFAEATAVHTISEVTRQRFLRFNGRDANVLVPPLNDPERFQPLEPRGYIFAGGRINSLKRQHLLVQAMAHAAPSVRLVIAGPSESPEYLDHLRATAEQLGVSDRVSLDARFLAREEYADYMNHSVAVAYVPFDEDALGYVTMEAAAAQKPTITCADSGGVLGLVRAGETGWVADPDPQALADAMTDAIDAPKRTEQLGEGAHELLKSLGLTWQRTVEVLTA